MTFFRKILRRIVISLVIGLIIGFAISEISFQLLKEANRAPEIVEIIIHEGTAEKVARGESPPDIPDEMSFVVGDTLLVRNNDSVDHQLGPLWIPPGNSASLDLDREQNFIFACSFQPSNYFDLDVREPVTLWTRVGGVLFSGIPLGAILALYSIITWPIEKKRRRYHVIPILKKMIGREWLITSILVLVGTGLCIRLGIWQLDRLEQRKSFNAHVQAMWDAPKIDLPKELGLYPLADMEYRSVVASGEYDYSSQVVLRNQYWQNKYGYHLLTPLIIQEGTAVLVDRGWISDSDGPENDESENWNIYSGEKEVKISGIIRVGQASPDVGGRPDPTLQIGQTKMVYWNNVNLERIESQLPYELLDIYIQLDPIEEDSDPPIPFQPELELSEGPHLGYAGQWFTFAAILFFGYPFFIKTRERRS